jgi:hypothetical protein
LAKYRENDLVLAVIGNYKRRHHEVAPLLLRNMIPVRGDQQRYVTGDNLRQDSFSYAYLLFSALICNQPANMSSRIPCSSGVNKPLSAPLRDAGQPVPEGILISWRV